MVDFVVEDGSGVAGATSYLTVEEADSRASILRDSSFWDSLNSSQKENALIRASFGADIRYRSLYVGHRATSTQGLMFPRALKTDGDEPVTTSDGDVLRVDEIPKQFKDAIAKIAFIEAVEPYLPSKFSPADNVKVDKVGPLSTTFFDKGPKVTRFLEIEDAMRPFISAPHSSGISLTIGMSEAEKRSLEEVPLDGLGLYI